MSSWWLSLFASRVDRWKNDSVKELVLHFLEWKRCLLLDEREGTWSAQKGVKLQSTAPCTILWRRTRSLLCSSLLRGSFTVSVTRSIGIHSGSAPVFEVTQKPLLHPTQSCCLLLHREIPNWGAVLNDGQNEGNVGPTGYWKTMQMSLHEIYEKVNQAYDRKPRWWYQYACESHRAIKRNAEISNVLHCLKWQARTFIDGTNWGSFSCKWDGSIFFRIICRRLSSHHELNLLRLCSRFAGCHSFAKFQITAYINTSTLWKRFTRSAM